jgi:hypothetical protein
MRVLKKIIAVAVAALALSSVVEVQPAAAWGGRYVSRPCGVNYISSWRSGSSPPYDYYANAQTVRSSGSCAGRLSVSLRGSSGAHVGRVYGDNNGAHIQRVWYGHIGGAHWGCDECGQSNT